MLVSPIRTGKDNQDEYSMKSYIRKLCLVLAHLAVVGVGVSQKQYNVLDWKSEYSVNAYLIQRMHQQYAARHQALQEALRSKSSVIQYAQDCRQRFLQVLGSLSPKTPLHPVITGTIRREGYATQKVIYESFIDHHVTANLYVPDGTGPFPGVLLFCGHEDAAKATESYQETAILFVRNGFVVLVIDPISQSERRQFTDSNGIPLVRGGTTEHTLLNATSNLLGTSAVAYELWDNVRGLDYLSTRPEIDASRIGCLGNSGGGMQTVYFLAYDSRVKVAAVCSFLSSRERNFDLSIVSDGCSQMPGEGRLHLEMSDYIIASAPTPVLVLAGRYDFIDYTGTVDAYNNLKSVYTSWGEPEKVSLFTYDDGHGISKPKREAAVSWFRRWLCNDSTEIHEPTLKTLSEMELWCTSTGQVNSQYAGEISVERRNITLNDSLEDGRRAFLRRDRQEILRSVMGLLSLENSGHEFDVERAGFVKEGSIEWGKVILRRIGEIPLPVLEAFPAGSPRKLVVWFPDQSKNKLADSATLMEQYLLDGSAVLLCDIRGMGETADKAELNDPKYYNREYRNAILALHTGESLVGQRVRDIRTVLDFVRTEPRLRDLPVEIYASGAATLPALHALLFEDNKYQLNLYNSLRSFKTILQSPMEKNWYSYVIPGVLQYYDIPDLIDLVGRQRVHLVD
jgi:dienelactone hydrolase